MITKAFKQIEVEGRTVHGYAARFNNIDHVKDMIKPGAFSKSIQEQGPQGKNNIMFLLQHDKKTVLGKPTVMREDSEGLWVEAPIIPTSWGNDALELIKSGVLDGLSIGYDTINQKDKGKYNEIQQVRLWEFSAVTFPCNELARITDVKTTDIITALDYDAVDEFLSDTETDGTKLLQMLKESGPWEEEFAEALMRISHKY